MSNDAVWASSMPAVYDGLLGPVLFRPFAEHLPGRAAATDPPPVTVLELAAGTGIVTRALTDRLPAGTEVTATDLNATMVALGERHAPGARWQQADALALPFADGSFDLVVCGFGVMFLPDKVAGFAEVVRVLRPGGRLLGTIWDRVETNTLTDAFLRALVAVLAGDAPDFLTRVPHGYADTERIGADLRAGGLPVHTVDTVTLPTRAASARALAEGFCQGTPLRHELAARGDLETLTRAVGDELTRALGPGVVEGVVTAHVVDASPA